MTTNSHFLNIKRDSRKQRKIYCYYSNYCYHKEQQLNREELKERSKEKKKALTASRNHCFHDNCKSENNRESNLRKKQRD